MKSIFRIHLSTAIVLMFTASAMLWANFASPVLQSIEVVREMSVIIRPMWNALKIFGQYFHYGDGP